MVGLTPVQSAIPASYSNLLLEVKNSRSLSLPLQRNIRSFQAYLIGEYVRIVRNLSGIGRSAFPSNLREWSVTLAYAVLGRDQAGEQRCTSRAAGILKAKVSADKLQCSSDLEGDEKRNACWMLYVNSWLQSAYSCASFVLGIEPASYSPPTPLTDPWAVDQGSLHRLAGDWIRKYRNSVDEEQHLRNYVEWVLSNCGGPPQPGFPNDNQKQ